MSKRELDTCSDMTGCDECTQSPNCYFTTNQCGVYNEQELRDEYFDQATEYSYCQYAISTSFIDISQHDYKLDLKANNNATESEHNLCEWPIALDPDRNLEVQISRDIAGYEEFYMYIVQENAASYLYHKNLTSCQSDISTKNSPTLAT